MYKQSSKPVDIAYIERNYLGNEVPASELPVFTTLQYSAVPGSYHCTPRAKPIIAPLSVSTFRTAGSSLAVSH